MLGCLPFVMLLVPIFIIGLVILSPALNHLIVVIADKINHINF